MNFTKNTLDLNRGQFGRHHLHVATEVPGWRVYMNAHIPLDLTGFTAIFCKSNADTTDYWLNGGYGPNPVKNPAFFNGRIGDAQIGPQPTIEAAREAATEAFTAFVTCLGHTDDNIGGQVCEDCGREVPGTGTTGYAEMEFAG